MERPIESWLVMCKEVGTKPCTYCKNSLSVGILSCKRPDMSLCSDCTTDKYRLFVPNCPWDDACASFGHFLRNPETARCILYPLDEFVERIFYWQAQGMGI